MTKAVVYFVEDGDFIKIGWCMKHNYDECRNLSELQRGNPRPLKYLGCIILESRGEAQKKEKKLHKHFKCLRTNQSEWFCKSDKLNAYIADKTTLCNQCEDPLRSI